MRCKLALIGAMTGSLLLLGAARTASAYCRTSTEKVVEGCDPSGANCCIPDSAVPIFWRSACIGFSMQEDGTRKREISYVRAGRTIAQAFNIWTSVSCPDPGKEASSRVSIDARQLAPVSCSEVGSNPTKPNQNLVVFRDDVWPHEDPVHTLALTSVQFDKTTGEIHGADLEFNSANIIMSCPNRDQDAGGDSSCFDGRPPENSFDFASIATHEIGHFLGLAHSNNPNATMTKQTDVGQYLLRTLTADDIAGICKIYPPDGTRSTGIDGKDKTARTACDPTPLNGFTTECATSGCSVQPGNVNGSNARSHEALIAIALTIGASVRRRVRSP